MGKKQLVRDIKRIALTRMEDAARTEKDFREVVKQWNTRDSSRRRKERRREVARPNAMMLHWDKSNPNDEKGKLKSGLDVVIPAPLGHYWWRQLMRGEFIEAIFDNPDEMWQVVEDWDVASQLLPLTKKQKEVLYLRAVRAFTTTDVADYQGKTDRAVRKLYTATIEKIQDKLAPIISEQIRAKYFDMTLRKRRFLKRYEGEKDALDKIKGK